MIAFTEIVAIPAGIVSYHVCDFCSLENSYLLRHCEANCFGFCDGCFCYLVRSVDAACDAVGSILGLLRPLEFMVWDSMIVVDADVLFVGFVSFCKLSGFIF